MTSGTDRPEELLGEERTHRADLGGGKLWIGRHPADDDTLVLDPEAHDASADIVSLYSLSQHRIRRFPRDFVVESIPPLTDEMAFTRAKKEYAKRDALREAHQDELKARRAKVMDDVRASVVESHRRFIESLGQEYVGVHANDVRSARPLKCRACGIPLDNFLRLACDTCSRELCSCGACACGTRTRR